MAQKTASAEARQEASRPREAPRPPRPGGRDIRPDFQEALRVLWQRKWSILALTGLVTGLALFMSGRQTPMYASEAEVLVTPLDFGSEVGGGIEPNMATEGKLASSVAVADLVVENLDLTETPSQILSALSVESPEETEILVLHYSHPVPAEAQRLAQGFADGYLEYRRQTVAETLVSTSEAIEREIDVLRDRLRIVQQQLANLDEGDNRIGPLQNEANLLQAGILARQLELLEAPERTAVGSIVEPAGLPSSPSSPNHTLNGGFGFFAGLALGIGLAFLRDRLAGRLRTNTQVESHVGASILASVPRIPEWRKRKEAFLVTETEWRSPSAEAYRILRTNLTSVAAGYNAKSILVTSANPGEGKTATAANVAVVLARAGKTVILVDGDLRRPRLHEFFKVGNSQGLVDVLSGSITLEKALVPFRHSSSHGTGWAESLKLLPSGGRTEAPAELLASDGTTQIIRKLEKLADYVIVDAPPILPVTDALVLARVVNGVLLVIGPRSITADSLDAARQQLDQVDAHLLGAALNGPDPSMLRSYYSY